MRHALLAVLCLSLVGCSVPTSFSRNMQAATTQSAATVAVKAILDEVSVEKYDAAKKMSVEVAQEISRFLDTGKIGDLPVDAAKNAIIDFMQKKGWTDYIVMVAAIFDIIEAQTVPVEKLGADRIAIIKLGLQAAITSAETSKVEWRNPPPNTRDLNAPRARTPRRVKVY